MASIAELVEEINTDKIKNGELIVCLEAKNLRVVLLSQNHTKL
ncbi:hypothetical protein MKZ07_01490 [Paenibacillus sp. FSL P4-0338]|nr:hypothetical protein [Paenibacillus sp. FSL R7-269]